MASVETTSNWQEAADGVAWNVRPFVDGGYRDSTSAEAFENVNPADESVLCEFGTGTAADIDAAVRVARARFEDGSWSGLAAGRRAEILMRLADLITEHRDEIALLDAVEMGKPIAQALFDAGTFCAAMLRTPASFADKLFGQTAQMTGGALAFSVYEPRGVVGAISPWNFPAVNAAIKIAPALAAGNTMVLKPSELSPSSALKIAELALEAGVPEGVLNVVPGVGETAGEALALHPDVDFLSFTGSTSTGRRVMELAARSNGKPVQLECGGKSPTVVFEDVEDLDAVADGALQTVLWNQGQVCTAHSRLIVHEDIADLLLEKVIDRAAACAPGHPLDESTAFGPLASPVQRDRVKRYIDDGLAAGAEPVLRGEVQESGGCYVSPFVFDRVDSSMSIVNEEIFGPVLCVQRFTTDEEALHLANGTEYGLSATVWTTDLGRGRRLAHRLRSGTVAVRTSRAEDGTGWFAATALSYEPQKASGFGSERALRGLEAHSTLKVVLISGD
jgi:acyl-CoA reductase-like NAD-dependent aldehyde dehydrogenase